MFLEHKVSLVIWEWGGKTVGRWKTWAKEREGVRKDDNLHVTQSQLVQKTEKLRFEVWGEKKPVGAFEEAADMEQWERKMSFAVYLQTIITGLLWRPAELVM